MDAEDVKALLPLYAAGSLPEEERLRMEDALRSSPELADELAFWRSVQVAVRLDAEGRLAGHPSGEILLAYLDHTLPDPGALPRLEEHFRACASCREELDFLRDSSPDALERTPERAGTSATVVRGIPEWLRGIVARRPVPVAAGILVVTLALVLVLLKPSHEEAPPLPPPADMKAPEEQWTALTLVYRPAMRGESTSGSEGEVRLPDSSAGVRLTLLLPASPESTLYDIRLRDSEETRTELSLRAAPSRYGGAEDTLLVEVARSQLSTGGNYRVEVGEILPAAMLKEGLTPNTYILPFRVNR